MVLAEENSRVQSLMLKKKVSNRENSSNASANAGKSIRNEIIMNEETYYT